LGHWVSHDQKAKARNIQTALDFIQPQHEAWIKKEMGVIGLRLKQELEGKSVLDLQPIVLQKRALPLQEASQNKSRNSIYLENASLLLLQFVPKNYANNIRVAIPSS